MTVSTTISRVSYSGNGSTVTFTVPFYFIYSTDLKVYKTSSANVQTLLVEGTDYTVTGAGVISGGSITCTTAPSSDYTIIIYRDPDTTQLVDYQANDPFPAETHERALDKLTMIAQRLNDVNDRSFHISDGDTSGATLEIASPEANYLIGWNSTGDALQNVDPSTLATIVSYATAYADTFTGDGTTTSWTLSRNPAVLYNLDVSINGVTQVPVTDYTLSGTTFTTTTAAPLNSIILVKYKEGLPNYSGDSQDVRYVPAGTGAVTTTVQAKLRETVSVKDFGAVGDGVTDDTVAINAALSAISLIGGGTVYFPTGTYKITSALTIPGYVILRGSNKQATKLIRCFTGNFIALGGYSGIEYMTIDGQTATYGAGKGVTLSGASPSAFMFQVQITQFVESCLEFGADAGSGFKASQCDFYTTGTLGTVAAIKVNGTDSAATSRHFTDCESGGCTLYDFGGCSDLYVTGGYSNGLIFGSAGSKVFIVNMRIGAAAGTVTISGAEHELRNCVFAIPVILNCNNSTFHCQAPNFDITDNGTNNDVYIKQKGYTPNWTSASGTPSVGDGSLTAVWSRQGKLIHFEIDLVFGSTTTVGTGQWAFSLPVPDYSYSPVQMCGVGFCTNAAGTSSTVFAVRVSPGNQKVTMYYGTSGSGTAAVVGATSPAATWGSGSTVRLSGSYYTV